MQSKIVAKTLWEFQIACKAAVIGILEGSIAPFNPTDIEKKHVYLYNGIFFSSAVDTEDTFKMCQGEVRAYVVCLEDYCSIYVVVIFHI